jgi:hypothetical protein
VAVVKDILEPCIAPTIDKNQIVLHGAMPTARTNKLVELGLLKTIKTQTACDCQGYRVYDPQGLGPALTASGGGRAKCIGAYLSSQAKFIVNVLPKPSMRL